ncbi:MAG: bifunctional riboflavin kinase/FAD synthetase [Thermodesulfobacteriota bacterium]
MKILKNGKGLKSSKGPVLTLGNFDGMHLGHQRILKKVAARARELGCPSVVYTFEPHPLKVVAPGKSPPLLLDRKDKCRLVDSFGIDALILARFTKEFASKHPREFVEEVLVRELSACEVWIGHDYAFGRGKRGTVDYLKRLAGEFGFKVLVVPAYRKKGAVVSSSRVRELLREGEVREAAGLLGRCHMIRGVVVKGRRVGKGLGFPTANLKVTSELVPRGGVYAAYAKVGRRERQAVVNIGIAPTFASKRGGKKGGRKTTVEVHMLDFKGDVYGRELELSFVKRIRDEVRFGSTEELSRQIEKDVKRARQLTARPL